MQYLKLDELKDLLMYAADEHERLMFLVMYWHGLRATEIGNLTGASIRDGFVDVKRLKGSLRTRQPYVKHEDPLLDESVPLAKLAASAGAKERLFPMSRFNVNYAFHRAAKKAGLPEHKRHPHVLKHTCAKTVIPAGIEVARQWLGHKSIQSTGEYLKIDDAEAAERVAAIVAGK